MSDRGGFYRFCKYPIHAIVRASVGCRKSLIIKLVDLVGIEPTTSSMPWKRAPKLRHRPTCCSVTTFLFSLLRRDSSNCRLLGGHSRAGEFHRVKMPRTLAG
jgi:hypothetical protein